MKISPQVQTEDRNINQLQQYIAQTVRPLLTNPFLSGNILIGIQLVNGVTTIPHGLNRMQQGWSVVDSNAAVTPFRTQPFNANNLVLTSTAAATVNIYVF